MLSPEDRFIDLLYKQKIWLLRLADELLKAYWHIIEIASDMDKEKDRLEYHKKRGKL